MIKNENFDPLGQPQGAGDSVATLDFRVANVTGTRELPLEVNRHLSVGDVTGSIAELMSLPDDVAWALRADRGQFLDERGAIGEQLAPGAQVTITPRTHLG